MMMRLGGETEIEIEKRRQKEKTGMGKSCAWLWTGPVGGVGGIPDVYDQMGFLMRAGDKGQYLGSAQVNTQLFFCARAL